MNTFQLLEAQVVQFLSANKKPLFKKLNLNHDLSYFKNCREPPQKNIKRGANLMAHAQQQTYRACICFFVHVCQLKLHVCKFGKGHKTPYANMRRRKDHFEEFNINEMNSQGL